MYGTKKNVLRMGLSDWFWYRLSTTLIGDSQNQNYLYLGTLIPFKLKLRSYISSMYFSWKYGLRMGQHWFWKMSFQTVKIWIKNIINILSILSCYSSSHTLNKIITVYNIYKYERWPHIIPCWSCEWLFY